MRDMSARAFRVSGTWATRDHRRKNVGAVTKMRGKSVKNKISLFQSLTLKGKATNIDLIINKGH